MTSNLVQSWPDGLAFGASFFGIVDVTGEDAESFLHGQLTSDIAHLGQGRWQWTGYCTAKGRLLATARCYRIEQGFRLLVARDIASALAKRLSMFVLRARVRVFDTSASVLVVGIESDAVTSANGDMAPFDSRLSTQGDVLCVHHDATVTRWIVIGAPDAVVARFPNAGPNSNWLAREVAMGSPWVSQGTQDQFVPQMINLEAVGGVSFDKGCYPGQEVVARSQYLGKVKRRMYIAHVDSAEPPPPGSTIRAEGEEAKGMVVIAAPHSGGGSELLAELPVGMVASRLCLEPGYSTVTEIREPPYPIPEPETFVRPRL